MTWMRPKTEAPGRSVHTPAASDLPAAPRQAARAFSSEMINIGKSVQIKGELTGKEDLTIDGELDGKIRVKDHTVRIGENGHIRAAVRAKTVYVAGEVIGNIVADEKVQLTSTGTVEGDITAPRVVLEDGARFKGRIDMEPNGASKSAEASSRPAKFSAASAGKKATGIGAPAGGPPRSASASDS